MAITLNLDARHRVNLTKLLPDLNIHSVKAYVKDDKIILEPLVTIPARELWLYENQEALQSVKKGLKEAALGKLVDRGSFAQYANDEI